MLLYVLTLTVYDNFKILYKKSHHNNTFEVLDCGTGDISHITRQFNIVRFVKFGHRLRHG